jgi:hypothetical protein
MKIFWLTTILEILLFLCTNRIQAQETVAASGGSAAGSGGTVSYTVGQLDYTECTNTSGTITQGVQQPYEIYVVTSTEDNQGIELDVMIYPNPASDFLKLIVKESNYKKLACQFFDSNGRLLFASEIIDKETVIQTGELTPAEYYLKVTDSDNEIKTFKIIKN